MKTKLVRKTTVPISLNLLIKGQPIYMKRHGFDVQLASSKGTEIAEVEKESGLKVHTFPYTRTISPITDLKALWLTYNFLKNEKPTIVHTHTPKAGIIGMLAAKLANVPIRMHTVAGLPLMEVSGSKRKILNFVEKATSWAATNVYPNSFSLKEFMLKERLASLSKLKVIGNGSSNGINTAFFSKNEFSKDELLQIKRQYEISPENKVFCFVGRIVKDKGINELLDSFDSLSVNHANLKLLLVGSQEEELDPLNKKSQSILSNNRNIISVGWQEDVRSFLAISDIFVFPSYREGFPNVVMQAGAMGLPSIVTDINGCNEIIKDQMNGLIIPAKDQKSLYNVMETLITDSGLRARLALNSRKMISERYEQIFVWKELLKEYIKLMDEKGISHKITIED